MPYTVRKAGRRWAITNTGNGHIAGYSTTRRKAAISASIRNGTHRQPRSQPARTRRTTGR